MTWHEINLDMQILKVPLSLQIQVKQVQRTKTLFVKVNWDTINVQQLLYSTIKGGAPFI